MKVVTHNRLLLVVVQSGHMPTSFIYVCPIPVPDMAYSDIFCKCTLRWKSRSLNPLGRSLL